MNKNCIPFQSRPWLAKIGAASAADPHSAIKGVIAGAIAGGVDIIIIYPTEYVKTQLQLDEKGAKQYKGVVDCFRKTIKTNGFSGLYRGLDILIVGSVPKTAIRFGGFEFFKGLLVNEEGVLSSGQRALAGLGAGIVESVLAVTPSETIKTKFINDLRSPKEKRRYKGLIHGITAIFKEEGIRGIYQGLLPTTLRQSTNQAIRFFLMETFKELYRDGDPKKPVPKPVVGIMGLIAGAASVCANTPIDVIKTRMQGLEAKKYNGTVDCFMKVLKTDGPLGLYKGLSVRLGRVCIDVALTFMLYDVFLELVQKLWP